MTADLLRRFDAWLRRSRLTCGCPDEGTFYGCRTCGHTRCEQHRNTRHDCIGAAR